MGRHFTHSMKCNTKQLYPLIGFRCGALQSAKMVWSGIGSRKIGSMHNYIVFYTHYMDSGPAPENVCAQKHLVEDYKIISLRVTSPPRHWMGIYHTAITTIIHGLGKPITATQSYHPAWKSGIHLGQTTFGKSRHVTPKSEKMGRQIKIGGTLLITKPKYCMYWKTNTRDITVCTQTKPWKSASACNKKPRTTFSYWSIICTSGVGKFLSPDF